MRTATLFGIMALTLAGGCALVYGYGDYEDQNEPAAPSCTTAADCPIGSECGAFTCVSGLCELQPLAVAGFPVMSQKTGDCQRFVCDDAGYVVTEPDTGDTPEDGNECTDDFCEGATPHNDARVGQPCGSNSDLMCNADGVCVGCDSDSDCTMEECVSYRCMATQCVGTTLTGEPCGAMAPRSCDTNTGWSMSGDVCNETGGCSPNGPLDCMLYACVDDVCGTTCTSNEHCVPRAACVLNPQGSGMKCSECSACNKLLTDGGPPEQGSGVLVCPGSLQRWQQVRECGCGEDCRLACGSVFTCVGANGGDPSACSSCMELSCPSTLDACTADSGHDGPIASP